MNAKAEQKFVQNLDHLWYWTFRFLARLIQPWRLK